MNNNKIVTPVEIPDNHINPDTWVESHGDVLYSYAYIRVREHGLAEDLVQETFLAALSAAKHYQGKSSVRTWLIGILRHKIIDIFRKNAKEQPVLVEEFYDETIEKSLSQDGNWLADAAKCLNEPSRSLEQKEFFEHFQQALAQLPPRLSQVFILSELNGMDSSEICKLMKISSSNMWVMMYRARMLLKAKLSLLIKEGKPLANKHTKEQNISIANQSLSYFTPRG